MTVFLTSGVVGALPLTSSPYIVALTSTGTVIGSSSLAQEALDRWTTIHCDIW